MRILYIILYFAYVSILPVFGAVEKKQQSLPRFASIKFNKVNARTGPVMNCPIEWVYTQKNEPIEIIAEYDGHFRKIRDINNEGGWVHVNGLSSKRFIKLTKLSKMMNEPDKKSRIIAKVQNNVICEFIKCEKDWCKVKCDKYKGWILRDNMWGIYENE